MKSLPFAIVLLSFSVLATAQAASIRGSGDIANLMASANGTQITLFITSGTDENGNSVTVLSLDVTTPNPDGTATERASFGLIPNSAFKSQRTKMSLELDTSQVAGFTNLTCIVTNLTSTCSPSPGGPVQVAWTSNGISSGTDINHVEIKTAAFTEHLDDQGVANSANAQGSALGVVFNTTGSGFNAFFGSDHIHTITITKN